MLRELPLRRGLLATSLMLACISGPAHAGSTVSFGNPVAMTVYLPLKNQAAAEAEAVALQTPGSPNYHRFLSVTEFVDRYALSDGDIARLEAVLKTFGLTTVGAFPNHLAIQITGNANDAASLLGTTLRGFTRNGRTGLAPIGRATIPALLRGLMLGIGGLDQADHPTSDLIIRSHAATAQRASVATGPNLLPANVPGNFLPAKFASTYDVNPLYAHGLTGRGRTIGIVAPAGFDPLDAYSFWQKIGLKVDPNRITLVDVDGSQATPTPIQAAGETTLDVEESGAIAPNASVRTYEVPFVGQNGVIDGFEAAASENIADTVSTSDGFSEVLFFPNLATGGPDLAFELQAFHLAFLEMALQGQTVFAAADDEGAFDTVNFCPPFAQPGGPPFPVCNAPYALAEPSSDPLVTAAGGTTLPFADQQGGVAFSVPAEQAWGWSYLVHEAAEQGQPNAFPLQEAFSVGGGGGVSSVWPTPSYQLGTQGITRTKPGQVLTQNNGSGPVLQYVLPPDFPGRNTPDLSTNADPMTGYQFILQGAVESGAGGTSFIAPFFTGVNALFEQGLGRTGQLDPALYALPQDSRDIARGNNWGYDAIAGYDNASGLGALDAARLYAGLASLQAK